MNAQAIELSVKLQLADFILDLDMASDSHALGVFGASGAGKTSLLEAVAGWRRLISGRLVVDGEVLFDSARSLNKAIEKRRIGYVPQDSLLFPHWTVMRNIVAGANAGRDISSSNADVLRTIEVLEIGHLLERLPASLSGGERQRVALARALASHPGILLLDEPLGSLDSPLRTRILPYLIRVREQFAVPSLFVSHDATEVQALCTDVIVLAQGRVTAQGAPSEVLRGAHLERSAFENVLHVKVVEISGDLAKSVAADGTDLHIPSAGLAVGDVAVVAVRADDIMIALDRPTRISARNVLQATVAAIETFADSEIRIDSLLAGSGESELILSTSVTTSALEQLSLESGSTVYLVFKSGGCRVLSVLRE